MAPNDLIDLGELVDDTYDVDAGTFEGTAIFVWISEAGLVDPESLTEGSFQVRC